MIFYDICSKADTQLKAKKAFDDFDIFRNFIVYVFAFVCLCLASTCTIDCHTGQAHENV